jgi:hypothetical protein
MPLDLTSLIMIAAVAGVGGYLGAYLREKGRNLATREDIATLTKLTEEVKSEISQRRWLDQKRWDFRRDIYWELLGKLSEFQVLMTRFLQVLPTTLDGFKTHQQTFTQLAEQLWPKALELSRADGIGRTVLPQTVIDALEKLQRSATDEILKLHEQNLGQFTFSPDKPPNLDELNRVIEAGLREIRAMMEKTAGQCEAVRRLVIKEARKHLLGTEGESL